ncbi:MAG TPA: ABC transporter permease, partial [Bacillota bacterium]|nr:ABC transporter permease [Bacillota bacterium]
MNILSIFKKECTHNIRDIKANVLMVLFPIVLMVILGAALSPMFNTKVELDYVEVLYTDEAQAYLSTAYAEFTDQVAREMGIEFEAIDNTRGAIEKIGDSNYSAYIHLTDKQEIKLYKNEKYAFEANLIEAITRSFVEKYNVYMELATKAPDKLEAASTMEMPSLLRLRSLDRKKSAESMDYYAVTMLTLILLYSSLTGIESIKRE